MNQIKEGDYIEHWEDGIGKIIAADDSTITVHFMGKGHIKVPREKTTYFKKLNPSGLLAQYYENKEHIQTLIDHESTEIIRLLILDVGSNKNTIERSRIKELLTSSSSSIKGWRSNWVLIAEDKWKIWWVNVNKKLAKDPWLDASSSSIITLREKSVSPYQSLHEKITKEKNNLKKISLCESLIKDWEKIEDQDIHSSIKEVIGNFIREGVEGNTFDLAIYNAMLLVEKGVPEDILGDNSYRILYEVLLRNALPIQKTVNIYSYISRLPSQDIFDHLIIFLLGDEKLRSTIYKRVNDKKWAEKLLKTKDCMEHLTANQIKAIAKFTFMENDHFYKALSDLSNAFSIGVNDNDAISIEKNCVLKFIAALLICPDVGPTLKETTANIVANLKLKPVVYWYLNRINLSEGDHVSYLPLLLEVIGVGNTEKVLINEMTAQKRPYVFLQALNALQGGNLLKDDQKQVILARVSEILSKIKSTDPNFLQLQVEKLAFVGRSQQESIVLLDASELVRIAGARLIPLGRRLDAVNVLINKGLKEDLQSVANTIGSEISDDNFVLLEHIYSVFGESVSAKDLLKTILEEVHLSGSKHQDDFVTFLINTQLIKSFAEAVLFNLDDNWHSEYRITILNLMANKQLAIEIIRFGIENIVFSPHSSVQMQKIFYSYCSKFVDICMEEMKSQHKNKFALSEEETMKLRSHYEEQLNTLANVHDLQVTDAIDKISQRYEEYLKRFIPILDDLRTVKKMVAEATNEKEESSSKKEIINKLSVIKENIEGVLKIARIIERE